MMESLLHTDRVSIREGRQGYLSRGQKQEKKKQTHVSAKTFVVEDALHLHGGPGVGDAEHGAGDQALQGRGAVRGPHQAPVGPVVAALQDLHRLAAPHRQLIAVAGHEVVDHHRQLAAPRELKKEIAIGNGELEGSDIYECVCVCITLSLSSVFCEVRDAREMVSGWLLPSPWLSRSSLSLIS